MAVAGREVQAMTLSFPNRSRAYDTTRRAVRFWGHDSAMEVSFFITEDALRRIAPDSPQKDGAFLATFDSHRDLILAAAKKVYSLGRKGSYDLVESDF
jgi:uncharacterized protein DUF1488